MLFHLIHLIDCLHSLREDSDVADRGGLPFSITVAQLRNKEKETAPNMVQVNVL